MRRAACFRPGGHAALDVPSGGEPLIRASSPPPAGPAWLHEVKHDGFRILAFKQDERVLVWGRRGGDFTDRFSRIADAVRRLIADDLLVVHTQRLG